MLPVHDWRDKGQYTEVAIMLVKCLILLQVSLVLIGPSSMVTASQGKVQLHSNNY